MILDAIIGLSASIFGAIVAGIASVFVPIINLIAFGLEALIGIFIDGFTIGRLERRKTDIRTKASGTSGLAVLLTLAVLIIGFIVGPRLMNQTVQVVAKDGHSLPFAAMIIHSDSGDRQVRTDNSGKLVFPRFSTNAVSIKDPRYVETTWQKSVIGPELTVSRTLLGSGLDTLADRLLKPAKE